MNLMRWDLNVIGFRTIAVQENNSWLMPSFHCADISKK
jgi:hypothetical protein